MNQLNQLVNLASQYGRTEYGCSLAITEVQETSLTVQLIDEDCPDEENTKATISTSGDLVKVTIDDLECLVSPIPKAVFALIYA